MDIRTRHFQASTSRSLEPLVEGWTAGWFRLRGYGIKYRLNPPGNSDWLYYSERHGDSKVMRIGRLALGLISPRRL